MYAVPGIRFCIYENEWNFIWFLSSPFFLLVQIFLKISPDFLRAGWSTSSVSSANLTVYSSCILACWQKCQWDSSIDPFSSTSLVTSLWIECYPLTATFLDYPSYELSTTQTEDLTEARVLWESLAKVEVNEFYQQPKSGHFYHRWSDWSDVINVGIQKCIPRWLFLLFCFVCLFVYFSWDLSRAISLQFPVSLQICV